ncbi:MAG: IS701 family transposase, partial [Chloroflexota bacterium]
MDLIPDPHTSPAELTVETVRAWQLELSEVERRIGVHGSRWDVRRRLGAYLRGLLKPVERKNGWQLAEANGDHTPDGMQHVLGRAVWDPEAVRDDVCRYVLEHLGTPQGVLVIDETGFLKKGKHSAGVARQYSGTAGRVENCQIGVFLAYASARGQVFLDRDLYLPAVWTQDPARCAQAHIPPDRPFATKPELARRMLERAFRAGVPAAWVTGDSVYGDNRRLRQWLEEQERAYVLAVSGKEGVEVEGAHRPVKAVLAALPAAGWTRASAGAGSKGPRWYDWCWLPVAAPLQADWRRWVLVRRSVSDPTALTAFLVFAPQSTTLVEAVQTAGTRWAIEICFEAAKGEVGLDQYEVRSWTGWYRHITLAMWAYALLSVVRARHLQEAPRPTTPAGADAAPPPAGVHSGAEPWVPLRVPEMRRLFGRLVLATSH